MNVSATHTICNMENHKMLHCQNCALTVAIFTVSIAIALSTSPTQAQVPVSKFTFDSPATLGDDSGTLNNDATGNIGSPAFSPTGVVGGSLMLDGSSAVIIPDAQDYNFASGFTVAAFVNIDPSNNDSARIFSRAMGGGFTSDSWGVGIRDDESLLATTYGVVDFDEPTNTAVPTGEFHHVAYLVDPLAGEVDFYLDGIFIDTDADTAGFNPAAGGSFTIGALNLPTSRQFFTGQIDELVVFDEILTAQEVAALAAVAVPEPTSIAVWSILGLVLAGFGWRRLRSG